MGLVTRAFRTNGLPIRQPASTLVNPVDTAGNVQLSPVELTCHNTAFLGPETVGEEPGTRPVLVNVVGSEGWLVYLRVLRAVVGLRTVRLRTKA